MVEILFLLAAVLVAVSVLVVLIQTNFDYLNPVMFAGVMFLVWNVALPLTRVKAGVDHYEIEWLVPTLALLSISFLSEVLGFLMVGRSRIWTRIISVFPGTDKVPGKRSLLVSTAWVFALLSAVSYMAMAILAGGVRQWILHSRESYQFYRTGVGHVFASSMVFLTWSFLLFLHSGRRRVRVTKLLWLTGTFCFLSVFWGMKQFVLSFPVIGVAFYHYYVKPLRVFGLAMVGVLLVGGFAGLLFFYGGSGVEAGLVGSVVVYADQFANTYEFLRRFGSEFEFQMGWTYLSSAWAYVPRAFVAEKPYVYGVLVINEALWPGLAEKGHTPAFAGWVEAYLNFYWFGVVVFAFGYGIVAGLAYRYLRERRNLVSFVVYLVVIGYPVAYFVGWPGQILAIFGLLAVSRAWCSLRKTLHAPGPTPLAGSGARPAWGEGSRAS